MFAYVLVVAGGSVVLFPLAWMISTSLKPLAETLTYPPTWLPLPPRWENYPQALAFQPFGRYLANSLLIAAAVVVGELISCSIIAYGFARLRFPGRGVLFLVVISTMMVPFIVRLIPLFLVFKQLGWLNTYLPLIVPSYFGVPIFIFLLRQYFLTIPGELAEAARLDGASELRIWSHIYMPLSRPALAVVAALGFVQSWNDFLAPLVFINDNEKWTAALGLAGMLHPVGGSTEYWNLLMASSTLMVLPAIAVFLAAQRHIIESAAFSGLKG